jgi:cyclophilin family peptidyl-prolyl cis-trans isomerase
VVLYLYEKTVRHRENFLKLAREGFYDGTTFHRIIPQFMVQGGDPNSKDTNPGNDGQGGMPYTLPAEIFPEYVHRRGALAAARQGDQVNPYWESSGCQFYIVTGKAFPREQLARMQPQAAQNYMIHWARNIYPNTPEGAWVKQMDFPALAQSDQDSFQRAIQRYSNLAQEHFAQNARPFEYSDSMLAAYSTVGGAPHLDMSYTVFGEVLKGMDVMDALSAVRRDPADRPFEDQKMTVRVLTLTWDEMVRRYGKPSVR